MSGRSTERSSEGLIIETQEYYNIDFANGSRTTFEQTLHSPLGGGRDGWIQDEVTNGKTVFTSFLAELSAEEAEDLAVLLQFYAKKVRDRRAYIKY